MLAAVELSRRGHRVFAGVRKPDDCPRLDESCSRAGVQVHKVRLDVTDHGSIAASLAHVIERAGAIDVVINNAGVARVGFFETMSGAHFDEVLRTNFHGPVAVARAVIPLMRCQGHGVIVNMSSMYGFVGAAVSSAYAASKWALEGWSESLRFELKPRGVYVSLVEAGHFATDMLQVDDATISDLNNPDSPYRLALAGMLEQYRGQIVTRATDPIVAARRIADIAETERPKLRYIVGADSRLVRTLRTVLPWPAFEGLFVAIVRRWMKGPGRNGRGEPAVPALP
jgi:NAD(P)-dependent dehydrogenase (short-subunit alcohol dehydrogenase family)